MLLSIKVGVNMQESTRLNSKEIVTLTETFKDFFVCDWKIKKLILSILLAICTDVSYLFEARKVYFKFSKLLMYVQKFHYSVIFA